MKFLSTIFVIAALVQHLCLAASTVRPTAAATDSASEASSDQCSSVSGIWYNQLGSKMVLQQEAKGVLRGFYWTAVERNKGAAGTGAQCVIGYSPERGSNKVFAYSVLWRGGMSVTSWTAQCLVCQGVPVLLTSWLLRPKQKNCLDEWKASMTGQDFYTRYEQRPLRKNGLRVTDPAIPEFIGGKCEPTSNTQGVCNLNGLWEDEYGNTMKIRHCKNGAIEGERRLAFSAGADLTRNPDSYFKGWANPTIRNTTISMLAVENGGHMTTGWTGQCHVCEDDGKEQIKASWFQRRAIPSCSTNWRSTMYGQATFTRVNGGRSNGNGQKKVNGRE